MSQTFIACCSRSHPAGTCVESFSRASIAFQNWLKSDVTSGSTVLLDGSATACADSVDRTAESVDNC